LRENKLEVHLDLNYATLWTKVYPIQLYLGNIMATAPITSTAARDIGFINKNEDLKSFAPKNKVSEFEGNKTKVEASQNVSPKPAAEPQEAKQAAKPNTDAKPAPVVNTRGEVTGSTINTSA